MKPISESTVLQVYLEILSCLLSAKSVLRYTLKFTYRVASLETDYRRTQWHWNILEKSNVASIIITLPFILQVLLMYLINVMASCKTRVCCATSKQHSIWFFLMKTRFLLFKSKHCQNQQFPNFSGNASPPRWWLNPHKSWDLSTTMVPSISWKVVLFILILCL